MSQETPKQSQSELVRSIGQAIAGLEFGEVHITVHHSRVVKIERVERIRVEGGSEAPAGGRGDKGGER